MAFRIGDISGQKFGRLTALSALPDRKWGYVAWQCICDCGNRKDVTASQLLRGRVLSCGCLLPALNRGLAVRPEKPQMPHRGRGIDYKSSEYGIWSKMKRRCFDPNDPAFERYGGRGITVDPAWEADFLAFLRDMGPRPSSRHSIDRIDNDGPYGPTNCRWATAEEQQRNKSTSVPVRNSLGHEYGSLAEAAEKAGVRYWVFHKATKRGTTINGVTWVRAR